MNRKYEFNTCSASPKSNESQPEKYIFFGQSVYFGSSNLAYMGGRYGSYLNVLELWRFPSSTYG